MAALIRGVSQRPLLPFLWLGILLGEGVPGSCPAMFWAALGMLILLSTTRHRTALTLGMVVALGAALSWARPDPVAEIRDGAIVLHVEQALPPRFGRHRAVCRDASGVRWLWHCKSPLQEGTQLMVMGRALPWEAPAHPWDFDAEAFWFGRGVTVQGQEDLRLAEVPTWRSDVAEVFERLRTRIRGRLMSANHPGEGAGLLLGLATGDKSGLSSEVRQAFSGLGLAHLTAVSGFHVGLVGLLMSGALFWLPKRIRWPLVLPLVWGYVVLCGAPSSAVRAAWMTTLAALALASGRRAMGLTLLSAVGILMWCRSPGLVRDVGTQLSFLATAGILLWHTGRKNGNATSPIRKVVGHAVLAIPWVATCSTAPVAWPVFGTLPWAFLPANVVASLAVPVFMLLVAGIQVLPLNWSVLIADWAVWLADGAVAVVVSAHHSCAPLILPRDPAVLRAAGALLALCTWAAVSVRKLRWLGPCGVILAAACLRVQAGFERQPEVYVLKPSGDCVVTTHGRVSVFTSTTESNPASLNWKTRSLTERVSSKPHMPVWHAGDVLVWSPHALLLRHGADTALWVSSSGSPSQSRCPHRTPKLPCP